MEKPGMGRGCFFGPRLLILLPLVLLLGQSAEVPGGESMMLVESSPERPVLDGVWRISILVDHPVPDEVTVIPPELPPSLTFAQSRKETRRGRWTLAEFLYVPHRTGPVTLGPFEVLAPGYRTKTEELRTYVTTQGGGLEEYHPRLVWDPFPAALNIGEPAELSLRIRDWDPEKSFRPGPFHATAPVEAILEEVPLTNADLEQGRVLRVRLTPLSGAAGVISLGPFTLRFDTLALEAPAISIRLRPQAIANAAAPVLPAADPGIPVPEAVPSLSQMPPPPFPETPDEPFPLFRKAYGETLDRARELWSSARYAEALAELRRGERDLLAGPKLAAPRRAAEQALGLTQTAAAMDEKWRPRNFFVALIILSACLLLLTMVKKGAHSLFFRGSRYGLVLLLVAGILGIAPQPRLKALRSAIEGAPLAKTAPETGYLWGSAAVVRAAAAYRVPDTRGAVSVRWMEGQPVHIRAVAGLWAYAESPDGDAGWVPQDNLVFY